MLEESEGTVGLGVSKPIVETPNVMCCGKEMYGEKERDR